jgi:LytS/YehU family sensor histidine kinase
VENAIKHGVARSKIATEISITGAIEGDRLMIRVANCIAEEEGKAASTRGGVGLANVRSRLDAVYGKGASLDAGVEDGRYVATISIPAAVDR